MADKTLVLYLSYDGTNDQLGRSQIMPYLNGLIDVGYGITVVSFEKGKNLASAMPAFLQRRATTDKEGYHQRENKEVEVGKVADLKHIALKYHKWPPVLSTVYDIWLLRRTCRKLFRSGEYKIVHCRSYIAALVGLWLKRKYGLKFILDMRGFWADERVEGGLWNLNNPFYRLVYSYFKHKEKHFIKESDWIVSLTENGKEAILSGELEARLFRRYGFATVGQAQSSKLSAFVKTTADKKARGWKPESVYQKSEVRSPKPQSSSVHSELRTQTSDLGASKDTNRSKYPPISVIPTCVDLDHFDPAKIKPEDQEKLRIELGISKDDFVLLYLGSLGTWYMLDEMLDFYEVLLTKRPNTKFLFLTGDFEVLSQNLEARKWMRESDVFPATNFTSSSIHQFIPPSPDPHGGQSGLRQAGNLSGNQIIATKANRKFVPLFISICSASIFFIKPSFSKKASAATKMGEIMAMGKPVITNVGWGDVPQLVRRDEGGILVKTLDRDGYDSAAHALDDALVTDPNIIRNFASDEFSLRKGVEEYRRIYEKLKNR